MKEFIAQAVARQNLTEQEAAAAMTQIMDGAATPAQIAALAVALRMKGETSDEIVGFARVMREYSVKVPTSTSLPLVDTCGTGGDQLHTFNISTTAAIIAAASGLVALAKHGNRAATSRCGSADVLEALGVNLSVPPSETGRCIDEIGIGFLYAPAMHPALKFAAAPRREIGTRTFFNLLGPLTNPAGAKRQLIGVFDPELCRLLGSSLQRLGADACLMAHGRDGLDELSTTAPTFIVQLDGAAIREWELDAQALGIRPAKLAEISGADTLEGNASLVVNILNGRDGGPRRDIACLNAAAVLLIGGAAGSLSDGFALATELVASGDAMRRLELLKSFTSDASAAHRAGNRTEAG